MSRSDIIGYDEIIGSNEIVGSIPADDEEYVVHHGDSTYMIALRLTGDGRRWRELVAANPDKPLIGKGPAANFASLSAREKLKIPERWLYEARMRRHLSGAERNLVDRGYRLGSDGQWHPPSPAEVVDQLDAEDEEFNRALDRAEAEAGVSSRDTLRTPPLATPKRRIVDVAALPATAHSKSLDEAKKAKEENDDGGAWATATWEEP